MQKPSALKVPCPICKARPGEPCSSRYKKGEGFVHGNRIMASAKVTPPPTEVSG